LPKPLYPFVSLDSIKQLYLHVQLLALVCGSTSYAVSIPNFLHYYCSAFYILSSLCFSLFSGKLHRTNVFKLEAVCQRRLYFW
jgi:hypothetical protein